MGTTTVTTRECLTKVIQLVRVCPSIAAAYESSARTQISAFNPPTCATATTTVSLLRAIDELILKILLGGDKADENKLFCLNQKCATH